ncbi:MAG: hypothetical protein HGN29_04650 [Asgard group archaeon]|nr:hypothetical protein [Asgard group archaeon]
MQREYCGADNDKDDLFCSKCEKSFSKAKGMIDEEEPLMVLKPKFVLRVHKETLTWKTLFATLFCTGFFGFLFNIPFLVTIEPFEFGIKLYPFIIVCVVSLLGFPILWSLLRKRSHNRTEYRIFKDRIEYQVGSFTFKRRSIFYENVAEVLYLKSFTKENII